MPLVSVVFPLPRSPVSSTSMGGFRRLANSLPHWVVSSAECVMISSLTRLQLLKQSVARVGNGGGNFRGEQAGLVGIFRREFGGFAVQLDSERRDAPPLAYFQFPGSPR